MRNILLPLIALGMLLFGVSHIRNRQQEPPQSPPPITPVVSPYVERIAGAGLVEAATENLAIGTHLQGIVDHVFVKVGQRVRANDPLFELD
jgi:HlyD family secretion protein